VNIRRQLKDFPHLFLPQTIVHFSKQGDSLFHLPLGLMTYSHISLSTKSGKLGSKWSSQMQLGAWLAEKEPPGKFI
jgi:hypothetical protein